MWRSCILCMGAQFNILCLHEHCIDVVLNRSNHLLVMINRLASFFLKSKLIIFITLCFRCVSKFWWLLHTCVCERLTYVPYDGCKLNLIDVLIVFHAIIMILHFFNLTTLTSTEWKKNQANTVSCFKLVIWYEYDILVTYVWIRIFLIWKLKTQNPFWVYFSLVLLRGRAVAVMFFGAPSFCWLTLSVCVTSELSIPTPLVFKL